MRIDIDYYAVLGILPSADAEVVRAAFRALARKFHPDTYKGDKQVAEEKMRLLNEAHDILSDETLRKKYDADRNTQYGRSGDYGAEAASTDSLDDDDNIEDWRIVEEYHIYAEAARQSLLRLSPALAKAFQLRLLRSKLFSQSEKIAAAMSLEFLCRYFGENPWIHEYVIGLLTAGHVEAAQEVNKVIKVLKVDPSDDNAAKSIIRKNRQKYSVQFMPKWLREEEVQRQQMETAARMAKEEKERGNGPEMRSKNIQSESVNAPSPFLGVLLLILFVAVVSVLASRG